MGHWVIHYRNVLSEYSRRFNQTGDLWRRGPSMSLCADWRGPTNPFEHHAVSKNA